MQHLAKNTQTFFHNIFEILLANLIYITHKILNKTKVWYYEKADIQILDIAFTKFYI